MISKPVFVIDVEKYFDKPIPHHFIHGYLKDDPETRFSALLPEPPFWKDRLIQFLEGGLGGSEQLEPLDLGYYVMQKYGAAYVKSNHGHCGSDLSKIGYEQLEKVAHKANYTTLLCAKEIMKEIYKTDRHYTYVVGGSGGGLRTTILLEKYPKAYHGGVAIVQAELSIITYYMSLLRKYGPILKPKFGEIWKAIGPDGTGDPYRVLDTEEQKEGLRRLYNAGFPRRAEWQMTQPHYYATVNNIALLFQELVSLSPENTFYQDFWTKKGYAGYEGEIDNQVIEGVEGEVLKAYTLKDVLPLITPKVDEEVNQPLTVEPRMDADSIPRVQGELLEKTIGFEGTQKFDFAELIGFRVTFKTGRLRGKSFYVNFNANNIILLSPMRSGYPNGINVGDRYLLDNQDLLAFMHYHRHIITRVEDSYRPSDFLRNDKPTYPQRPRRAKKILKMWHFQTGNFEGKLISIFATQDILVWPPVFFNYLEKVSKWKGANIDANYRYYFVENATHGPPINRDESFRLVSFNPMLGRSLDYLIDWVENGVPPPPSSVAKLTPENSLIMPKTASERKGLQPVINMITVDGQSGRATVSPGKPILFNSVSEAPVGKIIQYEWYCPSLADFYYKVILENPSSKVETPYAYTFKEEGIYDIALRVTSDLDGDPKALGGGQRNLSWVRVHVKRDVK